MNSINYKINTNNNNNTKINANFDSRNQANLTNNNKKLAKRVKRSESKSSNSESMDAIISNKSDTIKYIETSTINVTEQRQQRQMPTEDIILNQKDIIDFLSRINRLRFIDDSTSATSTTVQSPVENIINPFLNKNSIEKSLNDSKSRNYKIIMALKKQSNVNISSASSSSTDTLCSIEDEIKNGFHSNKAGDVQQKSHKTNTKNINDKTDAQYDYEDEEIKRLTSKINSINMIKGSRQQQLDKEPIQNFKPSNVKAIISASNRHRYRHQSYQHRQHSRSHKSSSCTITDTDSTANSEFEDSRKQPKARKHNYLSSKYGEKKIKNGKSNASEEYFLCTESDYKQFIDEYANNISTSILNAKRETATLSSNNECGLDEKYFIKQALYDVTSQHFDDEIEENMNNSNEILKNYQNGGSDVYYRIDEHDEEEEYDEDDKCFTSILVEDGFIRMSSPPDTDDDNISDEYNMNFCEYCKLNAKNLVSSSSNYNGAIPINNNGIKSCNCYLKNFPDVGSSPVTEEGEFFIDRVDFEANMSNARNKNNEESVDESCLSDDDDDDVENNEETSQTEQDDENDEIIIHNTVIDSKISQVNSNSTPNSNSFKKQSSLISDKKPQPIIKKSNTLADPTNASKLASLFINSTVTQQNTLNNEKIAQSVDLKTNEAEDKSTSKKSLINSVVNVKNEPININTSVKPSNETIISTSTATTSTTPNAKPKVRFNLDIDYEKEREWNRINKILGDASKSQIEWTDEVEV